MFVIVQGTYLAWMPSFNKNAIKSYPTGYGRQTNYTFLCCQVARATIDYLNIDCLCGRYHDYNSHIFRNIDILQRISLDHANGTFMSWKCFRNFNCQPQKTPLNTTWKKRYCIKTHVQLYSSKSFNLLVFGWSICVTRTKSCTLKWNFIRACK